MTKFRYEARDGSGRAVRGVVKASTMGEARNLLLQKRVDRADIEEVRSRVNLELTTKRVPREDLMHFSRQMAAFVRAGVPVLDAIGCLGEDTENRTMRLALLDISDRLQSGETLAAAMGQNLRVFPQFYVGMVESAELTGQLDRVLDRLSFYIGRELETSRKIRSALAYPAIIMAMSVVTVTVLTVFVLPRFRSFFASLNAKLPLPTRMLLATTNFMSAWWWALVLGLGLLGALFVVVRRRDDGRLAIDRLLLRIPVLGQTVKYAVIERFCRALASMVQAGVPLPQAMVVASDSTNNAVYHRALMIARDEMMEGEGIARPIARTNLFPVAAAQMMKVGEETGSLDVQLTTAADFFDQELDYKMNKLTTLFEPAVILLMGLLVGFVAVALISAMYGIFRQTRHLR